MSLVVTTKLVSYSFWFSVKLFGKVTCHSSHYYFNNKNKLFHNSHYRLPLCTSCHWGVNRWIALQHNVIWYFTPLAAYITCHKICWRLCYILCLFWLCYLPFANFCDLLTIFFKVASLELGQSFDCPSASEIILKNMGETDQYKTITSP